jgi:pyoverdine/dityrosine biosynthesis protein Dit1
VNFKFEDLNDIKKFAKYLSEELERLGYNDMARMISEFSYNSYTTSSEYLGEFRFLLNDLIKQDILKDNDIKIEVENAIRTINRAFGN